MAEQNGLEKPQRKTSEIIKEAACSVTEGVSGIIASKRSENILSASHIFQAFLKGRGLDQLCHEWDNLKEKGKIKDDYETTPQHRDCLLELLDFLDNGCPDEARFQTMKKIFLVAATETASDRTSLLPNQFLRLCREMTSGEIIVLQSAYKLANQDDINGVNGAGIWLRMIADASRLKHTSLVEIHEENLMKKYLLTRRLHSDRSGIVLKPHFRLTELAYDFCAFITNYDQIETP